MQKEQDTSSAEPARESVSCSQGHSATNMTNSQISVTHISCPPPTDPSTYFEHSQDMTDDTVNLHSVHLPVSIPSLPVHDASTFLMTDIPVTVDQTLCMPTPILPSTTPDMAEMVPVSRIQSLQSSPASSIIAPSSSV